MPGTPRARIRASSKARRPAPPHRRHLVAIPAQARPPVAHIGGRPGEQTHPRTTTPAPAPPQWLRGPGHLLKLPPSNRTQASRCGLLQSSYGTRGANVPSTQCPPPESRAGLWQQTGTFGTLAPLTRIRQSIGLAHPSEESSARMIEHHAQALQRQAVSRREDSGTPVDIAEMKKATKVA